MARRVGLAKRLYAVLGRAKSPVPTAVLADTCGASQARAWCELLDMQGKGLVSRRAGVGRYNCGRRGRVALWFRTPSGAKP